MAATITLLDETRSLEDLHRLALALRRTLEREAPVEAHLPQETPAPGTRGDAVSVGTLVLTFLTSGAAVAMFEVLRTLFARDRDLRIELTREDGARLSLTAHNMQPRAIDESVRLAREFFGEPS
jgi:hypothetical protein